MAITRVSPGIVKVEREPMTLSERAYLPAIFGGMLRTIKHLARNLFNMKGLPTISYPEVKRVYSERFRGRHILTTREDGTTRCVACYMCSTACPAECITIEAGEDQRTREKFPVRYDIDLLRCIFCGYCVDACPEDAIYMTRDYEMAIDTRARAVVGLRDLVVPPNFPVGPMGWRPYYGSMDKRGTAGGTGIGQPLREAPYEDDAPPNPDVYRGAPTCIHPPSRYHAASSMKPLETTIEEVLREAIQSEVETRVYYQKLAERSATPEARARLLQLADVELVHRAKLERKYRDAIGQNPPDPSPVNLDLPSDIAALDLSRALKYALERERDSESHYRFLAERVPATTELGRLFVELAEIEWKHKTDLQAEYDAASGPDQFLLDM